MPFTPSQRSESLAEARARINQSTGVTSVGGYRINADDFSRICAPLWKPCRLKSPTVMFCKWLDRREPCIADYDLQEGAGPLLDHLAYEHGVKLGSRDRGSVQCKWSLYIGSPCNKDVPIAKLDAHLRTHGADDYDIYRQMYVCSICKTLCLEASKVNHMYHCLNHHRSQLEKLIASARAKGIVVGSVNDVVLPIGTSAPMGALPMS